MIVVDTNVLVYLWVPGTVTANAEAALQKDKEWVSVPLWLSEFRNALSKYLRAGLMTEMKARNIIHDAEFFMHGNEFPVSSDRVLKNIRSSTCSAYDCEYVALAQQLGCRLLTCDKRLLHDFPDIAISLPEYLD